MYKKCTYPTQTQQDKHIQASLLRTGTIGVILGTFLTHATCNWSAHPQPPSRSTAGTVLHTGITSRLSPHLFLSSVQRFSTKDQNSPLRTPSLTRPHDDSAPFSGFHFTHRKSWSPRSAPYPCNFSAHFSFHCPLPSPLQPHGFFTVFSESIRSI